MATTYAAPGIYMEEQDTGARPIAAVGTSTAAFLGVAPRADAHIGDPQAVNNWTQFLAEFAAEDPKNTSTDLSHAVFGFFQNGGSRCYVVNLGKEKTLQDGLAALEAYDEVAIVAAPGYADLVSYEALLSHCENLQDRVALLDPPSVVPKIDLLTKTGVAGMAEPDQREPKAGERKGRAAAAPEGGLRPRESKSGHGAFYFPRIRVRDPLGTSPDLVTVPPSGHLAGIWARTDATRGVHKAPANEPIRGAIGLTYQVTTAEHAILNPAGVNVIRFFSTEGIKVWGARTVALEASNWRYLNVRRLFNMIEESIAKGTRWVVFEPNDRPLWQDIKRDVGAFLRMVWRDGALMGRTPEEAFFVKCDEETNPPESIDQGRVTIVIGVAPVKPAEFIIFRIGQTAGGAEIAS